LEDVGGGTGEGIKKLLMFFDHLPTARYAIGSLPGGVIAAKEDGLMVRSGNRFGGRSWS